MAPGIKQRQDIPLSEKVAIIHELEGGKKQCVVAAERKMPKTTVQNIWSKRAKILENYVSFSPCLKKVRMSNYPQVDKALTEWFDLQRSRNMSIDGPILMEKAKSIAVGLGIAGFEASRGWLHGWKKRQGVIFKAVSGEAGAVNDEVIDKWLQDVWPVLSESFAPKDIFNCDETGLFFKLLPNNTMTRKGKTCTGGKLSKERITVLLGANMDGSEKLKPVVIGKHENPRCFKTIKKRNLPVDYYWNSKAWMNQEIFATWLKKIDLKMRFQKRKILMLIGNCQPHMIKDKLYNVKLAFFPPNVTSKLQPMDMGIINETKKKYRSILLRKSVESVDKGQNLQIDILEAILNLSFAWNSVNSTVIANCFRHAKVVKSMPAETTDDDALMDTENDEILEIPSSFNTALAMDDELITNYVNFDERVSTYENSIGVFSVNALNEDGSESASSDSDGEDDPDIERPIISVTEASNLLERFKLWALKQDQDNVSLFKSVSELENFVLKSKIQAQRQSTLPEYFNRIE